MLNKSLTPVTKIAVPNTINNESIFLYLAATVDRSRNGKGAEIKPGQAHNLTLSDLGSSDQTFLIVKTLSDAKPTAYDIETS